MDWLDYLNKIVYPHATLQPDDEVILDRPGFIDPLFRLLARTPKRVLGNYIFWRVAMESGPYLTEHIRSRSRDFKSLLDGQASVRWKDCINFAQKRLEVIVGALYVNRTFDESNKNDALEMFRSIRTSFNEMLNKVRE